MGIFIIFKNWITLEKCLKKIDGICLEKLDGALTLKLYIKKHKKINNKIKKSLYLGDYHHFLKNYLTGPNSTCLLV